MSKSTFFVRRICQHCKKEFDAQRTTTQTCSDHCAKMYYKERKRLEKIGKVQEETRKVISKPIEMIQAKEFLTVTDAAKLLNCSRQTIYSLINGGRIKATNLKVKKTIIKRSEIDRLF